MVNQHKIRLFKPALGKPELKEIKKVFDKSWIGYGPKVKEFEKKWCKYFNAKYAVGVNSCTGRFTYCFSEKINLKREKSFSSLYFF